jgi:hypothetical protein
MRVHVLEREQVLPQPIVQRDLDAIFAFRARTVPALI